MISACVARQPGHRGAADAGGAVLRQARARGPRAAGGYMRLEFYDGGDIDFCL